MHEPTVELYRMATGLELTADDQARLAEMLAVGPEDRWAVSSYGPSPLGRPALEARALAGLFLLDEDIIWSARRVDRLVTAFRRLRSLIEGAEALRMQTQRFSAVNGGQWIETRDGRRLLFAARPHGGRGVSADCCLVEDYDVIHDHLDDVVPSLVSRANPQLVIST